MGHLQHRAPLFILNAAVYKEPLEIIERTIDDLTRLADAYSRHSGQAIIVIHDDLLGLLPEQDERVAQRVALYERKGVAFTVRGEGGRNVSFPKGPNVNVGMGFFVELLGRGDVEPLGRNTNETNNVRNVFACMRDLRARVNRLHAHPIFTSFEARLMWESLACRLGGLGNWLWAPPRPAVPTLAPLMLIPGAYSGARCEAAGEPGPGRHRQHPDDAVRRGKPASNVPIRASVGAPHPLCSTVRTRASARTRTRTACASSRASSSATKRKRRSASCRS